MLTAARSNVLFLAADDLRVQLGVDHVPGTHKMSTPNMDALISKSLFMRKAQVQQAVCSPTRASLLTSRYPDTTRVWDLYSYFRTVGTPTAIYPHRHLDPLTPRLYLGYPHLTRLRSLCQVGGNFTTIPQLFKENGYRTAGTGKIFHPGHASGADTPEGHGDDTPYSWSEPYFHSPNLVACALKPGPTGLA